MNNIWNIDPKWNKVSKLLLNLYEIVYNGDLIREDKTNGSKLLIPKDHLMMKPKILSI